MFVSPSGGASEAVEEARSQLCVAIVLFSLKWVTSLFVSLALAFVTYCTCPSYCAYSVTFFTIQVTFWQVLATMYAVRVLLNDHDESLETLYFAGELTAGLWTFAQLIGLLLYQHQRSKHLREIQLQEEVSAAQVERIRLEIERSQAAAEAQRKI